jgi:hypothetical protein
LVFIQVIDDAYLYSVVPGAHKMGDIKVEWGVSAPMASYKSVVDPDFTGKIDGSKVEESPAGLFSFRYFKGTSIPQSRMVPCEFHPTQCALGTKRNLNRL